MITLDMIVYNIKEVIRVNPTILSRRYSDNDLRARVCWWRSSLISSILGKEGFESLQLDWMQAVVGRKTLNQGTILNVPGGQTSKLDVGASLITYERTPVAQLYDANYQQPIDMVEQRLFHNYARNTKLTGGYIASCFDDRYITISPVLMKVSGYVMLDDPTEALVDDNGTVRKFLPSSDPYPVDGGLAVQIVKEICTELGYAREVLPDQLNMNPNDGSQP